MRLIAMTLGEEMGHLFLGLQDTPTPRARKILDKGLEHQSRKLVEEAMEVSVEALRGRRDGVIQETADLLFNLCVLLHGSGVSLEEIAREMTRRRCDLGLAEKLPKTKNTKILGSPSTS